MPRKSKTQRLQEEARERVNRVAIAALSSWLAETESSFEAEENAANTKAVVDVISAITRRSAK